MEKKLSLLAAAYFILGIIFAITFAVFYHWPSLSFFSPRFYEVALTWPFQLPGLIWDFQIYGWAGKTLSGM